MPFKNFTEAQLATSVSRHVPTKSTSNVWLAALALALWLASLMCVDAASREIASHVVLDCPSAAAYETHNGDTFAHAVANPLAVQ